jgi:glucose-6-phosphate-specific signal transduction histidine kinase
MSQKLAHKRYKTLMLSSGLAYAVSLIGITYFLKSGSEAITPFNVVLGLVPGLFVVGMLYSIWRYLKEMDEAARFFMTRSLLLSSFLVLAIAGVWGLLEMLFDDLPKLPVFWVFPIFFLVFGGVIALGPDRGNHCA